METKKKKYVKPKLTVAEWDFNEAVCQSQTFCTSNCFTVTGSGDPNRWAGILDDTHEGSPEWHTFGENNRLN